MTTHDIDIELPQGYAERPFDYSGDLYTEEQMRAAIEADRKRRGEPVAYRLLRKNADGDWVTDGRPWCDGIPDGDLVRDAAKSGQYRIEYAYAAPHPAEPIVSDVEAIVRLLERREWAEHVATTPLGQRLETAVTVLVGADPQPSEPVKESGDILTRLKALDAAATKKYRETASPYYEGQADAYDMAIQIVESAGPQPAEPVKRKRRYAQGTALGEFGIIPMCDQVDDQAAEPVSQHPDDAAVDAFAAVMKAKLAKKRSEGRDGWQECSAEYLSDLLRSHVEKGDPVDVANLAMMLHQNGQGITPAEPVEGAQ